MVLDANLAMTVYYGLMAVIYLYIAFMDWKEQLIDDRVILGSLVVIAGWNIYTGNIIGCLLGALAGAGLNLALYWITRLIYGEEAYGGGDVTLMASLGAFLGIDMYWKYLIVTFCLFFLYVPFLLMGIRSMPLAPHYVLSLAAFMYFKVGERFYEYGAMLGRAEVSMFNWIAGWF